MRFPPAQRVFANESWLHFHTNAHAQQFYASTDTRWSWQLHTPRDVNTHQIALLSISLTDMHTHINPRKEGWRRQFAKHKWRKLFYSAWQKGSISFHLIFNPNIEMGGTLSPYLFTAIRSATLNAYCRLSDRNGFFCLSFIHLSFPFLSLIWKQQVSFIALTFSIL